MIYDPTLKKPIGRFEEVPDIIFTNSNEMRKKIEELTDKVCRGRYVFNKPIIIYISSASHPNITIVDLPGLSFNSPYRPYNAIT
jgi:hypothetical protein